MSEPFIAEIKIFAGNFAPRGYAFCDGQLLPIAQNTALFALIGTTYGGDGRTTTGLPNLQGRIPVHEGTGPGLSERRLGATGGQETHTLSAQEMAAHGHGLFGSGDETEEDGTQTVAGNLTGHTDLSTPIYRSSGASSDVNMAGDALQNMGDSGAHPNLQPFLVMNFIIALTGVFPSRS
ncbi:MAG: phage tail protein [Gammaproteobacteria bacterium]|nr:phage tail protein [Gammaproteobacteria bacterium]